MNVAVRTVFVGDGSPDRVASATPAPTERLASWVSIVGGGLTAPLPAPPEAATWERALADLQAARVLYLAPGRGSGRRSGCGGALGPGGSWAPHVYRRAGTGAGNRRTYGDGAGPHELAARAGDAERGAGDCRRRRAEGLEETPARGVWDGRGYRDSAVVALALAS